MTTEELLELLLGDSVRLTGPITTNMATSALQRRGLSPGQARKVKAAFELTRSLDAQRLFASKAACPADIALVMAHVAPADHEIIWMLALSGKGTVIERREVAKGTFHDTSVSVARILQECLLAGSHCFVLVHNHPSGDPLPSEPDRALTTKVSRAAAVASMELVDHVIVTKDPKLYYSFKEAGAFPADVVH